MSISRHKWYWRWEQDFKDRTAVLSRAALWAWDDKSAAAAAAGVLMDPLGSVIKSRPLDAKRFSHLKEVGEHDRCLTDRRMLYEQLNTQCNKTSTYKEWLVRLLVGRSPAGSQRHLSHYCTYSALYSTNEMGSDRAYEILLRHSLPNETKSSTKTIAFLRHLL